MTLSGLKIGLVGPLPPPAGGMANQTRQLGELLRVEGAEIIIVQVNAPYSPRFVSRVRGLRAVVRLFPYVLKLWRTAARVDLFHVMANSGWSWHFFAVPAIWIGRARGIPVVVNYRGGEAASFLERSHAMVVKTLRRANALVVPSGYLREVFERHGIATEIVPNIIDLERFRPGSAKASASEPHLVVARNLEVIYDIPTALRAFALILKVVPGARLTVAGTGPERTNLETLAAALGTAEAVHFCGRLDRDQMADLYRSATVAINPSSVDNMPNSVLEAMASGVPVVSTNVGGVPFILRNGLTGFLVDSGDHVAMADAVQRLLDDEANAAALRAAALREVQQYAWPRVRQKWAAVYASVRSGARIEVLPA